MNNLNNVCVHARERERERESRMIYSGTYFLTDLFKTTFFLQVYNHFDMKHETASLLESRAAQSSKQWLFRYDKDQNEELLESMHYFIEAVEVHSSIDAGNKTRKARAQASLVSLQIRMPIYSGSTSPKPTLDGP
mgnify:CR=1 FL=1